MELRIGWRELMELIIEKASLPELIKTLDVDGDKILVVLVVDVIGELRFQATFAGFVAGRIRLILLGRGPKEQLLLSFSSIARTGLALNAFIKLQGGNLWVDLQGILEGSGLKGYGVESVQSVEKELLIRVERMKIA